MSFAELGLSDKVLQAVEASGYTQPTPIQAQAIPHVLARKDVLGIAQTGTGKTAAFTLPMLTLLETGRARARMPRTLILEPTRELAAQVEDSFVKYGVNHRLSVALLIGGVSFGDQDMKITRGVDVLIATPAAFSTISSAASCCSPASSSSSSTKPTACSTWASSPTSSAS
jgi:superfamily II DNA/RNA helicase